MEISVNKSACIMTRKRFLFRQLARSFSSIFFHTQPLAAFRSCSVSFTPSNVLDTARPFSRRHSSSQFNASTKSFERGAKAQTCRRCCALQFSTPARYADMTSNVSTLKHQASDQSVVVEPNIT